MKIINFKTLQTDRFLSFETAKKARKLSTITNFNKHKRTHKFPTTVFVKDKLSPQETIDLIRRQHAIKKTLIQSLKTKHSLSSREIKIIKMFMQGETSQMANILKSFKKTHPKLTKTLSSKQKEKYFIRARQILSRTGSRRALTGKDIDDFFDRS